MSEEISHLRPDEIPTMFPGTKIELEDTRESIAVWLEAMADKHDEAAKTDLSDHGQDRLLAIHCRARASDIRAGMDLPHG